MKLKTYQAWTMAEALAFVKTDLGTDAVILHTRTFERGGFFGIGRRSVVEITAARAKDIPRPELRAESRAEGSRPSPAGVRSGGSASDVVRGSAAVRAYGQDPTRMAAASATEASNPELDREKTRRLAQAMAIALEKQASERSSATQNEDAVREAALSRMASQSREQARAASRQPRAAS